MSEDEILDKIEMILERNKVPLWEQLAIMRLIAKLELHCCNRPDSQTEEEP